MIDIYKHDGIRRGLYRGNGATILRIAPYSAIKFAAYEEYKQILIPTPAHDTEVRQFVTGALAGTTTVSITYPLDLIRVRLAIELKGDERSPLKAAMKKIYGEPLSPITQTVGQQEVSGSRRTMSQALTQLSNFYRGFTMSLIGMTLYAGFSFLAHDSHGNWLRDSKYAKWAVVPQDPETPKKKKVPLRWWAEILSGAFAGFVSQSISYPTDVIRRRIQVGGAVGDGHRLRIVETCKLIWNERGVRGFYRGLSLGYVKVVPMTAISFLVWEKGREWVGII